MKSDRRRLTIVGGGVAALEAMLALRDIAEERVELELVTPKAEFEYRPLAVAEPFGIGETYRYDLAQIAHEHGAVLRLAGVRAVDADRKLLVTWDGHTLEYDLLLLAVGAKATVSIPGAVSLKGPGFTGRFRTVLGELQEQRIRRVAFAVPSGAAWPLPLYELALLTAARARERGLRYVELHLVTHESEPLELFGPRAASAVRSLLEGRGIVLHTSRVPVEVTDGGLVTAPRETLDVERVVTLPRLVGPSIEGLAHDAEGFIPVDVYGRVDWVDDVYAAGDATSWPIKQGGVAAQQADAAAEAIAERVGAITDPRPFRPVLRGLLLTGDTPRYMRAEISGGRGEDWEVSENALWWPPSKVAGRYLAPYLALRHGELRRPSGGMDVQLELGGAAVRRRTVIARGAHGHAEAIQLEDPGDS
jgi:sulfide:quinone oxidoreductase